MNISERLEKKLLKETNLEEFVVSAVFGTSFKVKAKDVNDAIKKSYDIAKQKAKTEMNDEDNWDIDVE